MRFLYQNKVYAADQEITIGAVNYIPGRLMASERAALGITEVVEQPMPDTRYNIVTEDPANPGGWIATPLSADQLKARLIAHAADARYGIETSGIKVTIGTELNVPLSTARGDDRAALHVTYSAIINALRLDTDTFKFADGVARVATNADMKTAIQTALGHVQGAFNKEANVVSQINSGAITTYDAIDAAFAA